MKGLISVVIINWDDDDTIDRCINSVLESYDGSLPLELIVVNSAPHAIENAHLKATIIENDLESNARAINLGIRTTQGDYVCLLQSNCIAQKGWLKGLIEVLQQDESIGVVQSELLSSDGMKIASAGIEEYDNFNFRDIGRDERAEIYSEVRELSCFSVASALFRRECIDDVGDFDEDLISRLEDVDYSIRCHNSNWRIFFSPHSIVQQHPSKNQIMKADNYFYSRNRLLLLGKHFPDLLPLSVRTSKFVADGDLDNLYHSLIQAVKKVAENSDTDTTTKVIRKLKGVIVETLGSVRARNFFSQLEVALGLRKIRVCIYDHAFYFPGGGQRYSAKLAEMLQNRYDVTYIANKDVRLADYMDWFGIDLSRCRLKIIKLPFYEALNTFYIDEGLILDQDKNPFNAISEESLNYDIFINANMLSKVKPLSPISIFICHFPDRDIEKFFYVDKYNYIITNSNYGSFWLKHKWGLESTLRLYPPVDMLNSESSLECKEKTIISVARFEIGGSKKQIEMAKAFSDLCEKNIDIISRWRLILAGGTHDGNPYFERVREEIDSLQGCNIDLMPNLTNDELKRLYCKASIFWHACGLGEIDPHLIEHFGMTTVEAMQNYCVPIVIDGGGQKEIIEQGVNGFRFKTLDELESYTLQVAKDDQFRKQLAREAYKRSLSFTPAVFNDIAIGFFADLERMLRGGEPVILRLRHKD